jgi:anti-sigma regulatory factor (Ser/Thr protein kinase)
MAADGVGAMLQAPRENGGDRSRPTHICSFHHEGLHRGGADGFAAYAAPLIEDALEEEAPVLVAVSARRISRLREALGSSAELVGFVDMLELGSNPARIIPAWKAFLARHVGKAPAMGIGEPVWPGRTLTELDECARHEGLLNLAFDGGGPWRLMCPYDLDGLDDAAIELARHSHPHLTDPHTGRSVSNLDHSSAQIPDWPFDGELPGPTSQPRVLPFGEADLGELRHFVSDWAVEQRLQRGPVDELVLAVNEIATNSIRHGGGSGTLRVWREDEVLLCEVKDAGHIRDPMLGRVEPGCLAATSRGLWIANQFCDLVQIRSSEAGSVVRMHKRLAS